MYLEEKREEGPCAPGTIHTSLSSTFTATQKVGVVVPILQVMQLQILRPHPELGDQKLGRGTGAGVQASVCVLTGP